MSDPDPQSGDESMSNEEHSSDEGSGNDVANGEQSKNGQKRGGDRNDSPATKKKRENVIEESILAENNRRLTAMTGDSLFVQFPDSKKDQIEKLGGSLNIWSTKPIKDTNLCTGRVTFESEGAADSILEKLSTFGLDDDVKVRKDNRESNKQNLNLRRLRIEKIPVAATVVDVAKMVPDAIEIRIRGKNLKGAPLECKDAAVVFDNEEQGKKVFTELSEPTLLDSKVYVVLDPARQWSGGRGFGFGRGGGGRGRFGGGGRRGGWEQRGRGGRGFGGGRGRGSFRVKREGEN